MTEKTLETNVNQFILICVNWTLCELHNTVQVNVKLMTELVLIATSSLLLYLRSSFILLQGTCDEMILIPFVSDCLSCS